MGIYSIPKTFFFFGLVIPWTSGVRYITFFFTNGWSLGGTVSFYVSVFVAYRRAFKEIFLPTRFLPTAIVPAPGSAPHIFDGTKGSEDD